MGPLVRSASRFLFPCTVEYSLLCAVILGVMWKNACSDDKNNQRSLQTPESPTGRVSGVNIIYSRSVSQFSVDCTSAHKGLFGGILMLVLSIVSLIMFYELVKRPELVEVAVLQVSLPDRTSNVVSPTSFSTKILCFNSSSAPYLLYVLPIPSC